MRLAPFLLLLSALASAYATPSFPTDEAAAAALDAPDFVQREKAARHLWLRGKPALPLLEKLAAGEAESSARARTILENIRIGISPQTPADLVSLVRNIHGTDYPSGLHTHLTEAVRRPEGIQLLLRFIRHQSESMPDGWEAEVGIAARILAQTVGIDSPIYDQILASVQGPALAFTVCHSFYLEEAFAFAYDALTFSPDPSKRPDSDRRLRVLEKYRRLFASRSIHLPPYPESLIAEAEKQAGDPETVPDLMEKLLGGTGGALHAFASTNIANESEHFGQWISQHQITPDASFLIAALIDQGRLPEWIEKFQTRIRSDPSPLIHLTLAQFHRADGDHLEAYRIAKPHTAHPTHEITYAILAGNHHRARKLSAEIAAELGDDKKFTDLTTLLPSFIEHLENPGSQGVASLFDAPPFLFDTRNYRSFADSARTREDIGHAMQLANVSPTLAREIISGLTLESLERQRGKIGEFLRAKRMLGEEKEVIDYVSGRFGTLTSDFWEHFLEKHFPDSPLWIMLHIRRRNPEMPRANLLRETLTKGTGALVPDDLKFMFDEAKASLKSIKRVNSEFSDNLVLLARDPRFESVAREITAWNDALPKEDPRRGILDPMNPRYLIEIEPDTSIRKRWNRFRDEHEFAEKAARSELLPSPAALLAVGKWNLRRSKIEEAVRWLTFAGWQSLVGQYWKVGSEHLYSSIDGKALFIEIHQSLESALGLQALEKGDFKTARKHFQNLCAMGSLDHQLGTALIAHLISSGQNTEAEGLFTTRWNQLGAILEIAPRDAAVCRARAKWSIACNRRNTEAETYASRAALIDSEQANLKTHLSLFIW